VRCMRSGAKTAAIVAALAAGFSGPAQAAAPDISAFAPCRAMLDEEDRLACFDRAAMAVFGPDEALDRRRAEHERSQFGAVRGEEREGELREISAVASSVEEDIRTGEGVVMLENGQVWQFLPDGRHAAPLRAGMSVTIARSAFGGYRLTVAGGKGFRGVRRLK